LRLWPAWPWPWNTGFPRRRRVRLRLRVPGRPDRRNEPRKPARPTASVRAQKNQRGNHARRVSRSAVAAERGFFATKRNKTKRHRPPARKSTRDPSARTDNAAAGVPVRPAPIQIGSHQTDGAESDGTRPRAKTPRETFASEKIKKNRFERKKSVNRNVRRMRWLPLALYSTRPEGVSHYLCDWMYCFRASDHSIPSYQTDRSVSTCQTNDSREPLLRLCGCGCSCSCCISGLQLVFDFGAMHVVFHDTVFTTSGWCSHLCYPRNATR